MIEKSPSASRAIPSKSSRIDGSTTTHFERPGANETAWTAWVLGWTTTSWASASGEAFGTETIGYGRRVSVIALPAPPVFLTRKGIEHVGPRAFGYDLDFRSVFDPLPFPPPQAGER